MDANQLAEGIARAVEAAKPAQEYCFLWIDHWSMCMTKAEWSGWMQAGGSALALAIAIALPNWQAHREVHRNYLLAKNCMLNLIAILYAIRTEGSKGDFPGAFAKCESSFSALQQTFQEVRVSLLPSSTLPIWQSVVTQSLQLNDQIASLDVIRSSGWTYHKWLQLVEDNLLAANERLDLFSSHEPRIWKSS